MQVHGMPNLVCDRLGSGIRVVRFIRHDLRHALDQEPIEDCPLYRELDALVLTHLGQGEALIINFGLIEWYTSAFHRFLLKTSETVQARKARLLLCCLNHEFVRKGFHLMSDGGKGFEVAAWEGDAVREAKK
jgi:hypothetical protein